MIQLRNTGPRKAGAASSTVAIGTASVFVVAAAVTSLLVDGATTEPRVGQGWTLRGGLAPADRPSAAPRRAAAPSIKVVT